MADLRFGAGGYTAPVGTVDLRFGADGEDLPENRRAAVINALLPVPTAGLQADARLPLQASISATLPAPAASAEVRLVVRGGMAATLAPPVAMVQAQRDINVYRDPSRLAASGWEQAERISAAAASRYQQGGRRRAEAATRYQQAAALARQQGIRARQLPRGDARVRVRQEHGTPLPAHHRARNRYLPWLDRYRTAREQQGAPLWLTRGVLGRYLPHLRTGWGLPYEQAARILALHWGTTWQEAERLTPGWRGPFEQAIWPPPGTSPHPVQPPGPGPEPFEPSLDLRFCQPLPAGLGLGLRFGVDPCEPLDPGVPEPPIDVPIQRTYLVSNSASLTLVATGQAIDVAALSVAIDADSWAWELRATVVGEPAIALVRDAAQPAEVEAVINGRTWRCVIDDWRRDRAWGQMPAATISARSLAAYLGAPYAAARSYTETQPRTAQQLAEQELPLGWTLDWEIDDWLVPPEAWHYTERTPIEAITAIAAAAGAVVQAHPSEPRLTVAPRYRVPHWAWGTETPDVTLPLDILTRLGTEYRPVEALNAVYVSGETAGVLALVRRTGTAGDRLAPMIVDPLTTEPAPARGRGIATLSATGEQTRETLVLPLADSLAGLLSNGQLLRIDPDGSDWRGLVRGVSINARLEGSGTRAALVVDQTVDVERHLEETA